MSIKGKLLVILTLTILGVYPVKGQEKDSLEVLRAKRLQFHALSAGIYAGTFMVLNAAWYKDYPKSDFHWINDWKGWNQIDKGGHAVGGYFVTADVLYPSYRKLGYNKNTSAIMAMGVAFTYMGTIELLDGFSEEWGASWSDIVANTAGITLAGTQALLWDEQRAFLKFSSWQVEYPNDPPLLARTEELFGTGFFEQRLKDYNGITLWLSVNPSTFMRINSNFPKWLCFAAGYGAAGMFGARGNTWTDAQGDHFDYSHIPRTRSLYFSPDIDFTRLPIKGKAWKYIGPLLNVLKFPAPTLELNSGELYFHPILF